MLERSQGFTGKNTISDVRIFQQLRKARDVMNFSQGLLDKVKAPHNCISKRGCLQMFYKGRSSYKFRKIYRKTPVSEFLWNKVTGPEPATLFIWKKRLQHKSLPVNFATFFKRPTLEENLQAAAFGNIFFIRHISEDLIYALKKFYNFLLNLQLC